MPSFLLPRRRFLRLLPLSLAAGTTACRHPRPGRVVTNQTARPPRLFFTSAGKTCTIRADGSDFRVLELSAPNQVTWQPGGFLADGRVLFLSLEARRDGPGRPFEKFYHQTPTHLWAYDLERGTLEEVAHRDRLAPFYTPQLVLGSGRLLVQVVRDSGGQVYSMNLDGTDPREFTRPGEGLPYGLSLGPDGGRVAFHLASPAGYQVWTSDPDGSRRIRVAAAPGHLYFGTGWSPDGRWVVYADCHAGEDPGHDWADVCVGRADGTEHRVLTAGQTMWFGATYGGRDNRGGGSNVPAWTHDGHILFPRRSPGAKVAWEYQPQRPDTDHFNRDYKPELARGGTAIGRLDLVDGTTRLLTPSDPPTWDFRATESADGRWIAFCRCATGEAPALWVMRSDGSQPRRLHVGLDARGADHPRWLPRG